MFKYNTTKPAQLEKINVTISTFTSPSNIIQEAIPKKPCRILLLPVELQIRIFILAQSPALAIVCKQFHELGQSDTVRAQYLMQRYGPKAVLGRRSMNRKIVSLGVVEQLLKQNCCDPKADGDYWLFARACEQSQIDLCKWVIESALSMENIQEEKKKTLIHLLNVAAMKGSIPVIDLLADTFHLDLSHGEEAALTLACRENQLETVKHLISKYECDVHSHREKHLRNACLQGREELVEFLLSIGSDAHAYNDAALQNATYNSHPSIVKLLLDAGANPSANQNACIRHAITNEDVESVKYLIAAGATLRFDRDWPLRYACKMGSDKVVTFLMDVTPAATDDENLANMQDGVLLKECIRNGKISTAQILLKNGANPNSSGAIHGLKYVMNSKTKTKNKGAMIKLLIEAGLDLNQQSDEVHRLLMPAISSSMSGYESETSLSWI